MRPFLFMESSFSDSFGVKRSVGSLLRGWYGPVSISADILACYVSVSRTTLARPLSAGRIFQLRMPWRYWTRSDRTSSESLLQPKTVNSASLKNFCARNELQFLIQKHLMLTKLSGLLICHLGPFATLKSRC